MPVVSPDSEAQRFYERQRAAQLGQPAITEKKMFGTRALCVAGKVFMFAWREDLVLKIPANRVEELIASGQAKLFDPGHGRTSTTWAAVFSSASECWPLLAEEARAFVQG
jgi:TfoX/Sxy family transcriptional regulator of competence genes